MTPAKQYERIPQTFAFREFVYGQPARGFEVLEPMPPKRIAPLALVPAAPGANPWFPVVPITLLEAA